MARPRDLPCAPDEPDQVPQADDRGQSERPSAGDERRMRALEALPPGHPSSPYLADGGRRPPQPSLRSLESPGEKPAPDTPRPPETRHHYWAEVPRFARMWADHVQKWPDDKQPAASVDRSRDPPESWRSDSNVLLTVEVHARAREAIGDVQRAERSTTGHVHDVERENSHGGWLEGLDFRLKGEDRLKEKVAETLRDNPDATPEEVVRDIPDTIRYTFCIQEENYTAGYWDIKERLEARGYEMYLSRNAWKDQEYKGINTRWMAPDGKRFELQFHTPESYHAKQKVTHQAYERARNPLTSKNELQELKAFQWEVSSWIPVPRGATDIPAYRRKGF